MVEEVFIVDLRKYRQRDLGRVQTKLGRAIIEKERAGREAKQTKREVEDQEKRTNKKLEEGMQQSPTSGLESEGRGWGGSRSFHSNSLDLVHLTVSTLVGWAQWPKLPVYQLTLASLRGCIFRWSEPVGEPGPRGRGTGSGLERKAIHPAQEVRALYPEGNQGPQGERKGHSVTLGLLGSTS